jgi:hypothetical protein
VNAWLAVTAIGTGEKDWFVIVWIDHKARASPEFKQMAMHRR